MPNHYDIDIYCKKCKGYMFTIYPDDPIPDEDRICKDCKQKMKQKPV